ncbi:hypothetical protein G5B37_08550 [Rasiella rasia]|uniref:Uncharacterized protein n=1 Tax=Rasiella rasia TaxID=2744027 RepID=A0A6G6GM93_9FLAO|nr:hypothetical protein [Rasiella rasia]QIE59610.1 hypothetical protein G5B37_08550 [Rasiella rasia]
MKLLSCKFSGHSLKEISTDSLYIKEFECTRCNQKYTTDGYGRYVKLTKYWRENNRYFETFAASNKSA